ncbi:hypothetical protein N8I77_013562 [Diaporthe amygdali]|uniref:Uncharacterized protein n=1 Tax=Phomopsis amygdali TaxID=1214568 RepID=A0AAD9VYK5_PHOAM|nr:hypothetical protein N8I77_013562 [Diaporthe amygdali]
MSNTSSSSSEAHIPAPHSTHVFKFCDSTEFKGVRKVVIRGEMRGLSLHQRAKLISSESRVCIAYRDGKQLIVLMENVNADVLYHYCPQLRNFYSCCKESGPTIVLPNTEEFCLVGASGVAWVVGSFIHENGVIVYFLKQTARDIKSPKAVGTWIRSLKNDPVICEGDLALLVEAYKIFARRTERCGTKEQHNE